MNISCSAKNNTCPVLLSSACVFYEGENLIYIDVNMNDNLQTALEKLNVAFSTLQGDITLSTIGSSGPSTFISNTLNIPTYSLSGLGGSLQAVTDIGSTTTNVITANGFTLPPQGIGLSTFKISQIMGENDYWNIYGYATVIDYGELVFELNDNAASVNGQKFRFYYNNSFSGTSKDILLMTYDGATIDGTLKITNLAGVGTRMVIADTSGLLSTQAFTTGTVTSVATSGPITGGTITSSGTIGITQSSASVDGYLSSTDWSIFNGKQNQLNGTGFVKASGTTITYDNSTYVPTSRTLTINGTSYNLSADRSWTIASGIAIGDTITSATAGSVLFAGVGGTLQQDNPNLFWDNVNNRLGIGTTTPIELLEIRSNANAGYGFGVINLYAGSSAQAQSYMQSNAGYLFMGKRSSTFTTIKNVTAGSSFLYSSAGDFALLAENGKMTFCSGTLGTAPMTLTAAGRLLLGTTSESTYIFDVVGNGRITGNSTVIATTASVTAGIAGWWASNGYVTTTIPASTSFSGTGYGFSSLIGNNYMTYQGSATFAADTLQGSILGINNFAFTAAASTITITQAASIRTYSAGLYQNTTSGSVDGTITHLSGLSVRPIYRASGSSTITVTNNYGLLINDQNSYNHAVITNRWGVYQEGASDVNYFAGKLLVGVSLTAGVPNDAGAYSLQVGGQIRLNNYTTTSSYTGTVVGVLGFDASGNIITTTAGGGMAIGGAITSATAGSVLFAGTSGVLQQDNANFFWDNTNSRLGIGTATPTSKLEIQGTILTDSGQMGSELTTTGSGTNWTGTSFATGYTHTTGSTIVLSTSLSAVIGNVYQVVYTITGRTTGTININFGGFTLGNLSTSGNSGWRTTATTALTITPTTDFNGTIVLSIKQVTASSAIFSTKNSSGTITNEIRTTSLNTNNFFGFESGAYTTNGYSNTAIGYQSLKFNSAGYNNVAIGDNSLSLSSYSYGNVAIGVSSMRSATSGRENVAVGSFSLQNITTGSENVSIGNSAGNQVSSGQRNVLLGANSGIAVSGGGSNTLVGYGCSFSLTTGSNNNGLGFGALNSNVSGSNNVGIGYYAGFKISGGVSNNILCDNSIYIGNDTKALASSQTNQIVIGYQTTGLGSNTTIIGNSSTTDAAIYGRLLVNYSTPVIGTFGIDVNGTGRIVSKLTLGAGTTSNAQINLISSIAPTSPNNGDIWFDGTNLKMQIGGVTKTFTLI